MKCRSCKLGTRKTQAAEDRGAKAQRPSEEECGQMVSEVAGQLTGAMGITRRWKQRLQQHKGHKSKGQGGT